MFHQQPSEMKNALWISEPTRNHNNHGLQIIHDDPAKLVEFRKLAWDQFFSDANKERFHGFWQGESKEWIYIEFWASRQPGVLDEIKRRSDVIATRLGMELSTEQ